MIPYIWRQKAVGDEIPVGGMRWASREEYTNDEGVIDWQALKDSVYYECQACGGRMEPSIANQHERNLSGEYIQTNPNADPELDFFQYNALAHIPWPNLVEQFKLAQIERDRGNLKPLENFIRKRLAEPWSEADYVSGDVQQTARGGYNLGEDWGVPNQFIFCTIDVQKDSYYFVIRSWSIVHGVLKSRQLERGHVITPAEIKLACDKWKIPQHRLGTGGACRVFLDGNYNTSQVQRLALEMGWMVFRGDAAKDYMNQDGIRRIYSDLKPVDAYDGTRNSSASRVGQFFFSKQSAKNRLSTLRELRDHNGDLNWTHADDAGGQYEKQLNSWAKIQKQKKGTGEVFFDWIQRKPDDHYFDCEVMNAVCASMCKQLGTESVVEKE